MYHFAQAHSKVGIQKITKISAQFSGKLSVRVIHCLAVQYLIHHLVSSNHIPTEESKHFSMWLHVVDSNEACGCGLTGYLDYGLKHTEFFSIYCTNSAGLVHYALFREMKYISLTWDSVWSQNRGHPSSHCVFQHCSPWPKELLGLWAPSGTPEHTEIIHGLMKLPLMTVYKSSSASLSNIGQHS